MSSVSSQSAREERERLVRAHLPLVRSVARRYLGRGESLDDLVQVGSIGLIKSSKRFDASRGVAFATFATPAIEGEIRRHLGGRASSLQTSADPGSIAGDAGEELTDTEQVSDDRLLVADSVRCLDEREQRIVLLRFHADMTERQIARTLGMSQAHVSRLLAGALAKLREELETTNRAGDTSELEAAISSVSSDEAGARIGGEGAIEQRRAPGETRIADVTASEPNRSTSKTKDGSGYSGRFLVRMPSSLHEQLAQAAERDNTSLNRWVTDVLARAVTPADDSSDAGQDEVENRPGAPSEPPLEATGPQAPERSRAEIEATGGRRRDPARALTVALATNLVVVVVAGVVAVALLFLALQRGI